MNVRNKSGIGEFKASTEEDLPLTVRQSRINTPALVVLLGSTASLAALEVMRHMLTLQPGDQRKVALVYIDTDEPNSSVVEFRQYHNGVFQEFSLRIAVPVGISHVERIKQELGTTPDLSEPHTFIQGKEPQYFSNGAGGIRNNGHVAASFHQQTIYDTLERALASIMHVDMRQNTQRKNEVQAYIVTFLGGGTGSGILADVTVMVRDLLARQQYEQRINLFCMLPEPVRGASLTDLSWRKSNTLACLLELMAYSLAAGTASGNRYRKYIRDKIYYLTKDAIANEIFLLGQTVMDDPGGTARLVGLDLFQRITDASGIGYLEHSKQVDRRTLGETDDRGLPTMFGTSCPLEVRFPAEETALAFAQISTASLLPLLANYEQQSLNVDERTKQEWAREWNDVAPIDANPSNRKAIKPGQLNFDEFEEADQTRLNTLWAKVERNERETELRIREVVNQKVAEEIRKINEMPRTSFQGNSTSLLNVRIYHLQVLQAKFAAALDALKEQQEPRIYPRPIELEADLTTPSGGFFSRLRNNSRDRAYDVFDAYNRHMGLHAYATRYSQLKQALGQLLQYVRESLETAHSWFKETDIEERMQDLETKGLTSVAWHGRLDYPHPHQRHIFDLRSLRASDGRSIATERLYLWATGGDKVLSENTPLEECYRDYVDECIDYLGRKMNDAQNSSKDDLNRLEDQNAGRLADRVVSFFQEKYMQKFQDMNLYELLDKAAPPNPKGQSRAKQISSYLFEHLQHIGGLMSSLVAFEAELWGKGQSSLETSIYLGMHWRNGYQEDVLRQALDSLGSLTKRGQQPMTQLSFDPHRLQASYGQHAISLATIRDFYLEQNSSMEAYKYHQERWDNAGSTPQGYMPTHSSEEAQRLVRERHALGLKSGLHELLVRRPGGLGGP
jgi:hypothetical protein